MERQRMVEWEQRQGAQAAYEAHRRNLPAYKPAEQVKAGVAGAATPTGTPTPTKTPQATPAPTSPALARTLTPMPVATSSSYALGRDDTYWKQYYQSQGDTHDCGPFNVAMMLNALAGKPGLFSGQTISQEMYQRWQRIPQSFDSIKGIRLPEKIAQEVNRKLSEIGGATPPWSMVRAFNQNAAREGIPWRAVRQSGGTKEALLRHLEQGRPVTVLKIWDSGGAHYETVVGYDSVDDQIITLDPGWNKSNFPGQKPPPGLHPQSWNEFEKAWSYRPWWARLSGIKNEMIVYMPVAPTTPASSTPVAVPAQQAPVSSPSPSATPEAER